MTDPDALLIAKRQQAELARTVSLLREQNLTLEQALAEARAAASACDLPRLMVAIGSPGSPVERGRELAGIDGFLREALRN